jgi:N-hydroxyarylamine O-acetyltransferase
MIHIDSYLSRIRYAGSLVPTLETLKAFQKQHLLQVPFENLDIHNQVPISLDIDSIFDKVVSRRRGGFCYELNGLFYELLIVLGFTAKRISARVFDSKKGYGQEFDHFAILVTIEGTTYLTDVGFGEFTFEPLLFEVGKIQEYVRGTYVINRHDEIYFRVDSIKNDIASPEYIFSTQERTFSEFAGMCVYHQTSPNSHFTQKRLITIPTENGRITITGNTLKITENATVKEIAIESEEAFQHYLKIYFAITL